MKTVAARPPAAALDLTESTSAAPLSPLREDGTVDIHIIRPGLGLGRGRHFYPASMLQENADKFTGWRVYIDHLSPEAKKAQGGLPRSMRDLGGMIEEAWWDGSVPGNDRHEAGAVVGRLRPIGDLRAVIEELPQAVEFSIKAKATDVAQEIVEGAPAWVVEGIREAPGSVDAVTEAGAGGRIADLVESLDGEQCLQEARDLGLIAETEPTVQGDGIVKELEEALLDPKSRASRLVAARAKMIAKQIVAEHKTELMEAAQAKIEPEQDESGAATEVDAKVELLKRDLRDEAHRLIEEAKLPATAADKLRGRYDLDNITVDKDGAEASIAQVREAVAKDIAETREILGEVNPTRITGQGAGRPEEGTTATASEQAGSFWREHLEEAGIAPDEAFELRG